MNKTKATQVYCQSLLLLVVLSASGCAHLSNRAQCPRARGVMCQRVDQINAMVDAGELPRESQSLSGVSVYYNAEPGKYIYAKQLDATCQVGSPPKGLPA